MTFRQYETLRALGQGQFGDVHLAVGEVPGRGGAPGRRRLVAIKSLREARNPESLRLLRQEFALLEQVKHRAIVRVFEYLESEHAVVMEYVHGVTLRTVLDDCAKAREQVFTEAAIEIGCEVADALYQAWTTPGDNGDRLRLVHRDLKPENIMLTPEGDLKVLDFGLARVDNADFVRDDARRVRGTPLYMAPEQARGEELDHRTDLFALGLILYELLMGRPAYQAPPNAADPVAAAFAAIEGGALGEQCRELEAKLPGMGPVVARLLQANPRNRYANGQDLLVDLRRQLYKDRGSYLREFCSFYFGSLHPLGTPPDPDAPQGGRMSTEKRKSMEERLAESLSDADGEPGPRAPVPVRRAPKPAAAPPPPMAPPPMPTARTSAPPKITPRSTSAARPSPPIDDDVLPPSVKGKPTGGGAKPPPKPLGARSPTETGMLPMVPLGNEDEAEVQADPSATAFFAIPAPKSERPKAAAPPPAAPSFTPPGSGARPASPGTPPQFVPPAPGTAPMAPPVVQSAPQGGIGLGAAGGIGLGGAAATPFQVNGPTPAQGSADESRMQSTRVYAVIFAALAMVCLAVVAAGGVIYWKFATDKTPEKPVVVADATPPAPVKPPPPRADTGQPAALPTGDAKRPRGGGSKPSGGGGSSTPPPPRASATGNVTATFTGTQVPLKLEITCDNGFQNRVSISGGTGVIPGVPTSGACKMYPKGGVVGTPWQVHGGASYTCSIEGTTTTCR